jgi:predicted TIM-barrel fold metal-dependent hydrolase
MTDRLCPALLAAVSLGIGCGQAPRPKIDAGILDEIQKIRAIDNHGHPVSPGQPADRYFDALPVDNLEASSDTVALRPGFAAAASTALYGGASSKAAVVASKGGSYPAWVLDQAGIDVMLANRVVMAQLTGSRFRWVPYADALIFPLDNSGLAAGNSDRKAFFTLEDQLRTRYWKESGITALPSSLSEYVARVITPVLERHKAGGALAEKFEAAYLRTLAFDPADRAEAERIYVKYAARGAPTDAEYKTLQDYLFRGVAEECGRLGMAIHLHTNAGAGSYFDVDGANPIRLQSVLNDPQLRKTNFVMVHGGWPYTREISALLTKPNAWLDFSSQDLMLPPANLGGIIREWLEYVPEKVLFGTDAYPYSNEIGWEESAWMAARTGREALAIALTGMVQDGEISRQRASELARMVLRGNAEKLYRLQ